MRILDRLENTTDIKKLTLYELKTLAGEIREEIVSVVKSNGGHLSSNLGIVETTLALYYTFDFPSDKLVFDVGHQCYCHKILSDRKQKFSTIRLDGGISGFQDAEESEYDAFSTGHAGTSIAVSLGLCTARDKLNQDNYVVNVIGDGALVNGLSLEAITAKHFKPNKYIVILNDNGMSISKNKNGFYRFITKQTFKKSYVKSKNLIKRIFGNSFITKFFIKIRNLLKRIFGRGRTFDKFGFKYVGVINGNDLGKLIKVLKNVKEFSSHRAVFLHLSTTKGKGMACAEEHSDLYHGVGKELKNSDGGFASALADKLNDVIEKDNKVIAITAGMKDGTGLIKVEEKHPDNVFDVGIAEEYAVTYSAGMAKGGLKPIVCIYSTFLQRAYDQILHDVCLQNLPVIFCLDRAGLVGADGKTHQGVFDLSYLTHLPNMTVLCPTDEKELGIAIDYALSLNSPVAIRYPKDAKNIDYTMQPFPNWLTVEKGRDTAILAVGPKMVELAIKSKKESGRDLTIISARTVKPLDTATLDALRDVNVITLEENSEIGGFGSQVLSYREKTDCQYKTVIMGIKDKFVKHGSIDKQLIDNEFTVKNVISKL